MSNLSKMQQIWAMQERAPIARSALRAPTAPTDLILPTVLTVRTVPSAPEVCTATYLPTHNPSHRFPLQLPLLTLLTLLTPSGITILHPMIADTIVSTINIDPTFRSTIPIPSNYSHSSRKAYERYYANSKSSSSSSSKCDGDFNNIKKATIIPRIEVTKAREK